MEPNSRIDGNGAPLIVQTKDRGSLPGGFNTLVEDMVEAISNAVCQKLVPHLNRPGQNISVDDPIWGTGEVAQYLGVSTDLIQKLISKREIPFFKVGDRNRFRKSRIDKWAEGRTVKPLSLTGHFSGKGYGTAR